MLVVIFWYIALTLWKEVKRRRQGFALANWAIPIQIQIPSSTQLPKNTKVCLQLSLIRADCSFPLPNPRPLKGRVLSCPLCQRHWLSYFLLPAKASATTEKCQFLSWYLKFLFWFIKNNISKSCFFCCPSDQMVLVLVQAGFWWGLDFAILSNFLISAEPVQPLLSANTFYIEQG